MLNRFHYLTCNATADSRILFILFFFFDNDLTPADTLTTSIPGVLIIIEIRDPGALVVEKGSDKKA